MRAMLRLTWDRIDLWTRQLWIPEEQMKGGHAHGLPRIGKSGFSSLDARLESLLAQPTEPPLSSSKKS